MRLGEGLTESRTDWARIDAMTEEDIQEAIRNDPDTFEAEDWMEARLVIPIPRRKESIHLRVDPDVLAWFKAQGKGHLSRMNAVLRQYKEHHAK